MVLTILSSGAFANNGESYYDRIELDNGVQYVTNENGKYLSIYDTDTGSYMYSPRLSKEWLLGPTIQDAVSQGISSNLEYCELQGKYHPPTQQDVEYLLSSLSKGDQFAMQIIQGLGWDKMGGENLKFTSALLNNENPQNSWRVAWYYDINVGENNAKYSIFTEKSNDKTYYSCAPDL